MRRKHLELSGMLRNQEEPLFGLVESGQINGILLGKNYKIST